MSKLMLDKALAPGQNLQTLVDNGNATYNKTKLNVCPNG